MATLRLDVWSDVVCPWCLIGKARVDRAVEAWRAAAPEGDTREVERVWHAFELMPDAHLSAGRPNAEHLAAHKGMTPQQVEDMFAQITQIAAADGIEYDLPGSIVATTRDAHRVAAIARLAQGGTEFGGLGDRIAERFLRAHLCEGADVGDHEALVRLAVEAGLAQDDVRAVLDSDAHGAEVDEDLATARQLGIRGVPFVVVDQRYGVSGAQPVEVFTEALERAAADRS